MKQSVDWKNAIDMQVHSDKLESRNQYFQKEYETVVPTKCYKVPKSSPSFNGLTLKTAPLKLVCNLSKNTEKKNNNNNKLHAVVALNSKQILSDSSVFTT